MIPVRVTGGFTRSLRLTVTDDEDQDLSGVTFKIALTPKADPAPIKTSDQWRSPTGTPQFPENGVAVLRLTVNESIMPPGEYWAWVLPTTALDAEPVRASDDVLVSS